MSWLEKERSLDSTGSKNVNQLNQNGLSYFQNKKYDLAIECFTKAIEVNDKFKDSYTNRGIVYMTTKQWTKAIVDLDKAINLGENDQKIKSAVKVCQRQMLKFQNIMDLSKK